MVHAIWVQNHMCQVFEPYYVFDTPVYPVQTQNIY